MVELKLLALGIMPWLIVFLGNYCLDTKREVCDIRRSYEAMCDVATIMLKTKSDENAHLRALLIDAFEEFVRPYGDADDVHEYADRMSELGIEVDG